MPEFWTSEQVISCSMQARLLFIGLWNFCDDAGIWCDFATGDKGDLLELWCQVKQVTLRETIQQATPYLGIVMH